MSELGQILVNLVNIIPAGLVVFFPSYKFLNTVQRLWANSKVLEKIAARKTVGNLHNLKIPFLSSDKIFHEPSEAAQVENILREYAEEIRISVRVSSLFAIQLNRSQYSESRRGR